MTQPNTSQLERIGSIAVGSALIASSIVNVLSKPGGSLIKLIAGGLFIWRGASGYCPVKAGLGLNNAEQSDEEPVRGYYPAYPSDDDYPHPSEQDY